MTELVYHEAMMHLMEDKMKYAKEENAGIVAFPSVSREWVAPQLTVLNAGATAGGPTMDTLEASTYYPS